ncbi:MAG: hypothetical protein LQ346_007503 [Caloplaca aetnensis]|nr:MAG: hypothetical protein LQ346_007503 [Caloplaca aetnensis]
MSSSDVSIPVERAESDQKGSEAKDDLSARLKAKTGFTSYQEYMRAEHGQYTPLYNIFQVEYLQQSVNTSARTGGQHCSVIDIAKSDDWSITRTFDGRQQSISNLFDALNDTRASVSLRIVIWPLHESWFDVDLVNTLALILRLDPRFLSCVFAKVSGVECFSTEIRPLYAKYVLMGNCIATFGRLAMQEKAIPFVLLAGMSREGEPLREWNMSRDIPRQLRLYKHIHLYPDIEPDTPLSYPHEPITQTEKPDRDPEDLIRWYIAMLRHLLTQNGGDDITSNSLPLASLLPMLQLSSLDARDLASSIRRALAKFQFTEEESIELLYAQRKILRRWLEDTEDNMEHLERYIELYHRSEWLEGPIYKMLDSESTQLAANARHLETEVRDFLQIESGASALKETKKSIELSNLQIRESKRVKLFTVLAFIYVPLNLATSIFGMNLEQLNASGQQLRVFFVTAISALLVTGSVWFCIDQVNDWFTWRDGQTRSRTRTKFSLAVRSLEITHLGFLTILVIYRLENMCLKIARRSTGTKLCDLPRNRYM